MTDRFLNELISIISISKPALARRTRMLFAAEDFDDLYPSYLLTLHWLVRASVSLMVRCREECLARSDNSVTQVYRRVSDYMSQHILEEQSHDDWLLDDLGHAGFDEPSLLARVPSINAANLVGAQYYWLLHFDPVSLLGYLAVIEGSPLNQAFLAEVVDESAHPEVSFRSLFLHANEDPNHAEELYFLLSEIELSKPQQAVIRKSSIATLSGIVKLLDDLLAQGTTN